MNTNVLRPSYPGARIAGNAHEGTPHSVLDPATGEEFAAAGWVDATLVDAAVRAACEAWPGWAATSGRNRARALRAVADELRADADRFAQVVTAETGKRIAEGRAEVLFSADYFDHFAEVATAVTEEHRATAARRFLVRRHPVGVVAAIAPWNFPLSIPARKLAPALAAGCPVVLKPSDFTPLSAHVLVEICERHLPPGTVNLINGDGEVLGNALVDHPDVAAVTLTGSTRIGALVGARAASTFTRCVLELGGRAPFVICEDSDTDTALESLLVAKFRNNGASCIAANNIFVHESRYEETLDALVERVLALRVGDPRDDKTDLGPLLRPMHVDRLRRLVNGASDAGCRVWSGGNIPDRGFYLEPSVIEARQDVRLWNEEVFGPACVVRPYTDEDTLVAEVNGWGSGLGGYVVSADLEHATSLAARLRIGIVGVNNGAPNTPEVPFGGFGTSGVGREGSISGLLAFTEEQTISTAR